MNKTKKRISVLMIAILSLMFGLSFNTVSTKAATSGDYALKVAGDDTDNVNIDQGNYQITGKPGDETEVKLGVLNKAKSKRKFYVSVNSAYTSNQGSVSFDKAKVSDPNLKIQTGSLFTPKNAVFSVPGGTMATLTFKMKIPEKQYKGTLMGAFTVSPYKEKAKGTVSSNGTLIKNKFSYSIPIQVHQTTSSNQDVKFAVATVKPAQVSQSGGPKPGVVAKLANLNNAYISELNTKAIVTKKDDKSFKITDNKSGQALAPTSRYDYSISWGSKALKAGSYHLKLKLKTKDGIRSWEINKDFTITNSDAAKYNKLAGIKPNYLWLYILLGVLALAIILGLGIYLGRRNNNKGDNSGNNKPNNRRRR
ncbi:DUF916 and DUF3324 domain-containing protein [Companilactobacillus allii]|uniref:Uncharacterized protein n=1 Tax=Companilactobacillus allii TaxID=1847728 RepID=A0A1P8Q2D1_9LACO|nr:DUF3324 domain-containing protein [Companilactobacillus allii]APX72033.1 hypothetical protein BTM29_05415 [Companilactobacillus allii]USQ69126.1 DUF916 and DUF3324 domain-containing protein [Companilactobacillus allii]